MTIERISAEEMPKGHDRTLSAENVMFMNLETGEAFKTPCRWKHSGHCSGSVLIRRHAKRYGRKARTACRDGTFYAMRVA